MSDVEKDPQKIWARMYRGEEVSYEERQIIRKHLGQI